MNDLVERLRELKRRRDEGVSTIELDPLWGDTLKNWRECPSDLSKEIKSTLLAGPFTLWKKDESWLIFSRFYYHFELPRLGKRLIIYIPGKVT